MRAIIQRVSKAVVRVEQKAVGQINKGLLVYLGVGKNDGAEQVKLQSCGYSKTKTAK